MLGANTVPIESLYSQVGRIPHAEIIRRAEATLKRGLPSVAHIAGKYRGKLIIAGGGPSLTDTLPDIRRQLRLSKTTKVATVNRTHDFLLKKGLKPDFGVLIDPKPWVANYMTPTKGVTYCLGAKLDEKTWQRFAGHPQVYHWHNLELAEERDRIASIGADYAIIPGQSTVGLRSIPLGFALGFRKFELHGLDCNKRGSSGHAYQKFTTAEKVTFNPEADLGHQVFYVSARGFETRYYEGTSHMARQLGEFKNLIAEYRELERRGQEPCDIRVAGDSAMGYLAAIMGLHVNETYNESPHKMPKTGCLTERELGIQDPTEGITIQFSDLCEPVQFDPVGVALKAIA